MTDDGGPVPGWYQDPGDPRGHRWWDGRAWTGYTSGFTPLPAPSPHDLTGDEEKLAAWARRSAVAWSLLYVLFVISYCLTGASLRHYFHFFGQIFDHLGTPGYVPPRQQPRPPLTIYLTYPVFVPLIVFVVWQHRAAKAARALNLPARHTPGWGVAGWFVPIIQFWFPAQALADCLPPDHPVRPRVWKAWVLYLCTTYFQLALLGVILFAPSATVPVAAVLIVGYLALGWMGSGVVEAIGAAHGRLADDGSGPGPRW